MADKLLKSIKFPTLPDRYVIGDSTLTEEGAAADAKAVGDALATKADTEAVSDLKSALDSLGLSVADGMLLVTYEEV